MHEEVNKLVQYLTGKNMTLTQGCYDLGIDADLFYGRGGQHKVYEQIFQCDKCGIWYPYIDYDECVDINTGKEYEVCGHCLMKEFMKSLEANL